MTSQLSNSLLQAVLDTVGEAIITINSEGSIVMANPEVERIWGYSHEELIGSNLTIIMPDKYHSAHTAGMQRYLSSGEKRVLGKRLELEGQRKNGEIFPIDIIIKETRIGDEVYFTSAMRDITEPKRVEQELLQAKLLAEQANAAKSDFLSVISHEIRTPLNIVIGMCDLLNETQLQGKQHDYVKSISKSGKILFYLVSDVLDFSKIEAGKLELDLIECDLPELVEDVASLFVSRAQEHPFQFNYTIDKQLPDYVMADAGRLVQVLTNLLSNAFKFTEYGSVTLNVSCRPSEHEDYDHVIHAEIIDTGIGIAKDTQKKLFSEFVQADTSHSRKFGGTGLGLAICRRLVELMQGTIGLSSEESQGSTFWFDIPLREIKALPEEGVQKQRKTSNANILLVEDSEANRMLATTMLGNAGYQVDTAENGELALECLSEKNYHLILMDIQMPGMNGYEVTQKIKAMAPPLCDIPILAMTANVVQGEKEKAAEYGMVGYIPKPFKLDDLIQSIEQNLNLEPAVDADPVDMDVLQQLYDSVSESGAKTMLQAAAEEMSTRLKTVESVLSAGSVSDEESWQSLCRELHTIKSLSGTFAAKQMYSTAAALEQQCKERNCDHQQLGLLNTQLQQFKDYFDF